MRVMKQVIFQIRNIHGARDEETDITFVLCASFVSCQWIREFSE
jgi:hypothetical protein